MIAAFRVCCAIVGVLWLPTFLLAFDLDTHVAITLRSLQPTVPGASNLDNFLKTQFPTEFSGGIEQGINGKQVQEWIALGSQREDSPFQRVQKPFTIPPRFGTRPGLVPAGLLQ